MLQDNCDKQVKLTLKYIIRWMQYVHAYVQDFKLFKEKISLMRKALLLHNIIQDQSKYKYITYKQIYRYHLGIHDKHLLFF